MFNSPTFWAVIMALGIILIGVALGFVAVGIFKLIEWIKECRETRYKKEFEQFARYCNVDNHLAKYNKLNNDIDKMRRLLFKNEKEQMELRKKLSLSTTDEKYSLEVQIRVLEYERGRLEDELEKTSRTCEELRKAIAHELDINIFWNPGSEKLVKHFNWWGEDAGK